MQINNSYDPKEKNSEQDEAKEIQSEDEVYLENDDGTPFDDSERTYISVDMPEEEEEATKAEDGNK
jgi:hypothetical protein